MINKQKSFRGFTLIELTVSISIISIVALLGLVVIKSSSETVSVAHTKGEVQGALRDVMAAMTSELELAKAQPPMITTDQYPTIVNIAVSTDKKSVTFQRPVADSNGTWQWSTSIVYKLENEDTGTTPNGKLDTGEDTNADGILNRRIVRIQNGQTTAVGGSNDITGVVFDLLENVADNEIRPSTLRILLQSSKRHGTGLQKTLKQEMETQLTLQN